MRSPSSSSWWLAAVVLVGCSVSDAPDPQKVPPPAAQAQAGAEAAQPKTEANPEAAQDDAAPALTEEELALIAADPKDLTVEQRRKRAYARRKQIMQNPDSPTARALQDLAEAHQNGEIDVGKGKDGVWFSTPGTKPVGGRPPAGYRPSEGEGEGDEAKAEAEAPAADGGAGSP